MDLGLMEKLTDKTRGLMYSYLLGFLVRLIPEIFSYPFPIGFDTVYYMARIKEGVVWYHWSNFFDDVWLLNALLVPLQKITLNSSLTLKIASPILYGLNAAGIYYFANKALKWKPKKSLLASILFSFSLASLRISWDLYRNILGIGILLFSLALIEDIKQGKNIPFFLLLSMLTVFSHEFAATIFHLAVLWIAIKGIWKDDRKKSLKILAFSSPSLVIFTIGIYLRIFPIYTHIDPNVTDIKDLFCQNPLGIFFLENYLSIYSTYSELAHHIISLFMLLYIIWLPLIVKGFFRDEILEIWRIVLLAGSFGPLLSASCSLLYWYRWMFMLIYPFTFYATNGIEKILNDKNSKWLKRIETVIALMIIAMGVLYITLPGAFSFPTTIPYFPSSMKQNTIPIEDVDSTANCLGWLNQNMNEKSCVLVHHAFVFWAIPYLDKNHTIIYYVMNITKAVEVAKQNGFKEIYLVWWSRDIGWYPNIKVLEGFEIVNSSGRIGIYRLCP